LRGVPPGAPREIKKMKMARRIPENILEDILSRIDIVEVISGYIPLKKSGRNFKALCPFHHEKTSSFMVSPDRQIYHCFGCGAGGNAFNFLMQYERLEFLEAVEMLANKAGVALPRAEDVAQESTGLTTQLYKVNEAAAAYFEEMLNSPAGAPARSYLLKRGINEKIARTFRIGFAPDRWDGLINSLRGKGFSLSLLEKAGLILNKQGGGYYDRFRNRVIFPIFDTKSRAIGFGGRILEAADNKAHGADAAAKYVNSPETPVYNKGRHLYGLNVSKDSIRDGDSAVVVEGYLDFIIPYSRGLASIVASLGTALTREQARLLKRYTNNVIMVYDGDAAGEIATLRTLDIFIEEGIEVRVAPLPSGFDPDSFVGKNGIEKFNDLVGGADNLFDYKLKVLRSRYRSEEIEGKAKICSEMLDTIRKFKNAVLKSEYLKRLSHELDVREEALLEELKNARMERDSRIQEKPLKARQDINPTEKLLIKLMLEENAFIERLRGTVEPADFRDERTARIVSTMLELAGQGKVPEARKLVNYFGDSETLELICESSISSDVSEDEKEKLFESCLSRLKSDSSKNRMRLLHEEIKDAQHRGDEGRVSRLLHELNALIKK